MQPGARHASRPPEAIAGHRLLVGDWGFAFFISMKWIDLRYPYNPSNMVQENFMPFALVTLFHLHTHTWLVIFDHVAPIKFRPFDYEGGPYWIKKKKTSLSIATAGGIWHGWRLHIARSTHRQLVLIGGWPVGLPFLKNKKEIVVGGWNVKRSG